MIAAAKAILLALAVGGAFSVGAVATGTAQIPLEQAKEVLGDHLVTDDTLPDNAMKGQQTAYDNIMANQEKWLAKHPLGADQEPEDDMGELDGEHESILDRLGLGD